MSEITFSELRRFNSGASDIFAINKFNGLIFISLDSGEIWTRNSLTGRFLLNSIIISPHIYPIFEYS